jgi:hypothetical protein
VTFAAAAGLWLAAIAIPIVALYILKVKRHRRVVPYLKLWLDLLAERQFSTLFRKLQRLFSLLLQLLIAACLVLAFAALTLSDSFLQEESVVLVVDTSASMRGAAKDGEARTRFEAALAKARELVEGRSPEDEFAILAAGPQPDVLQAFSRSTLRLREALDKLAPSNSAGDLREAHRLARDLLQGRKHPRIVVLSDRAGGAVEELAASDGDVRWIPIGDSVANVAIVRFQARKNEAVGTDYLLLVVANFADTKASAQVEIEVEGRLVKVLPLDLEAGARHEETLELTLPEGGFATAKLAQDKPDALALDDVAFAAIPPARLYRVVLVTARDEERTPFRAIFAALEALVDREASIVATPEEWEAMDEPRRAAFDLAVFVNHAPAGLPARGNFLLVNALAGGLPARERPLEATPRITDAPDDHPLNRFLEPKSMQPALARPLDLTGGEPFLQSAGGPIGVVFRSAERKVVYLGLDVLADLFFLQVAFPIVLRNALAWMHEQENRLLEPTYAPGDVIRPRFSLADANVEIGWLHRDAPQAGRASIGVRDGRFSFAETAEPGRYWVRTSDADHRTAVNLFDARESDLRMPAAEPGKDLDIERAGFLFGRDLWPLLLLAAAALWLLEWGLYHRRFTE